MPIYKEEKEEKEEAHEKVISGSFMDFMNKESTRRFISDWHKKGYTKAGIEELLYELHARYCSGGGSGDDDDEDEGKGGSKTGEDKVIRRAGEMLDIMKSVRRLFEPFKSKTEED